MFTFSLVICSHRAPRSLDLLLASLNRQALQPGDQVILVDNGIDKNRKTEVKKMIGGLPCGTAYVEESKPGLGAARIRGFAQVTGKWILLLDDDNELLNRCLEELRAFAESNPAVGGICPAIHAEWEVDAPLWLQKVSCRILSVNHCGEMSPSLPRSIWSPAEGIPIRPPGGGMAIRTEVAQEFCRMAAANPIYVDMDRTGGSLLGCQDEVIYSVVNQLRYATAYLPEARILHHLPAKRASMKYLCNLAYSMALSNALLRRVRIPRESIWSKIKNSFFVLASLRKSIFSDPHLILIDLMSATGLIRGIWGKVSF